MGHDHNHSHGTENVSDGVLLWTVIVNLGLSVFEFVAGAISGSVALMADALHNTNDAAALLIAYIARKISRKGADGQYTFGYRRAELIGAMIQLTALILVGLYLVYEAVRRFFDPEPLLGGWIMAAAGVALVVDVITAWLLWSMSKGSLNVKAAFLHNLTAFVEFHLCGESRFSPKSFLGRFAELPFASAREKPSAGGVRAAL